MSCGVIGNTLDFGSKDSEFEPQQDNNRSITKLIYTMEKFVCADCDICILNNYNPLVGDGIIPANIMFVGRNPDNYEHKHNIPFINKAGALFQRYLNLFNFSRDHIFITNAVKCKTPSNRIPVDVEIYNCGKYLDQEIATVNPKIIVLLGTTAIRTYFKLAFTDININIEDVNGKYMIHKNRIILFAIHPSHALSLIKGREQLFVAFTQLVSLYRYINPAHETNIIQ